MAVRQYEESDKASDRHGQKGTCGHLEAPENMPVVVDGDPGVVGIIPDILLNPQGMPGRMTMARVWEMFTSNRALAKGELVDATPFLLQQDAREVLEEMLKEGDFGHRVRMMCGITGELIEGVCCTAALFIQRLKHMGRDKIAARSEGLRSVVTQQPMEGKSNHGGQRFGEMESDALDAHGAAFTKDDRVRIGSDAHTKMVCRACKRVADTAAETLTSLLKTGGTAACSMCGAVDSMVAMPTTYCWGSLFQQELNAAGAEMLHTFAGDEEVAPLSSVMADMKL
jgi:DNA-directed RNA polymerase I subunit RPA2